MVVGEGVVVVGAGWEAVVSDAVSLLPPQAVATSSSARTTAPLCLPMRRTYTGCLVDRTIVICKRSSFEAARAPDRPVQLSHATGLRHRQARPLTPGMSLSR